MQMILVFFTQKTIVITMDGIFSYTLANNPYTYLFIDDIYSEFPQNNGWLDAHILKENYVVEAYDRFNYAAVYHHQRHDVHPPLYYFAVHTISSLFPGRYSNLYTMGINLLFLLLSDIILIKICRLLYGSSGYSVIPIVVLMSMESMRFLLTWARMYMMLFGFCLWYLYIHAKLLVRDWKKADLVQLAVCIFLGTLTHYYFYIYAGTLTALVILYLIFHSKIHTLINYMYSGIVGIAVSWIFYPWVLWHIFLNGQNKHKDIESWSLEKGKEYLFFLREQLVNDRWQACVILVLFLCLGMVALRRKSGRIETEKVFFRKIVFGSGLLYSFVIYTLDGGIVYYATALYAAFIVWISMVVIDLIENIKLPGEKEMIRIGVAVICVGILYPGSMIKSYVENAKDTMSRMYNGKPLEDEFHQISENYSNYNCIYIEKKQDNLFQNYWFEFGEYRMFKKISLEEFTRQGIRKEDLEGCGQGGDGIVVYVPEKCELSETDYRWLANDKKYNIYEYMGED